MRDLTFSVFRHVKDTTTTVYTEPWERWVELFSRHEVRGQPEDGDNEQTLAAGKDGRCVVLGCVDGRRAAKNVRYIDALSIDLEHLTEAQLEETLALIVDYEWVLWSTHRSGAAVVGRETRLRVVLPLARRLEPGQFFEAWDALQKLVHGRNDPNTRDVARLHFLPSTFDAQLALVHHNKGRWFDYISKKQLPDHPREAQGLVELHAQVIKYKRDFDGPLNAERREIVKKLLKGEALAEPGGRHQAILMLTMWLAYRFPAWTEPELEALFSRSLAAMQAQSGGPIQQKEIWDAFAGACDKLAVTPVETKQLPEPPRPNPYTADELKAIAEKQHCAIDDLEKRWIIQKQTSYWVLRRNGEYSHSYGQQEISVAARQELKNAPVMIWSPTQAGGWKKKALVDLIEDNGTFVEHVVADLNAQYSFLDSEQGVFHEAVTPLRRDLEAKHDPLIEEWLSAFGGEEYAKILDWLSCAPDLSKSLCALYFDGTKEAGKTLFAVGVARLWTEGGPAEASQVFGSFNDEVLRCPLVLADEKLPKLWGGNSASAQLRAMLGIQHRSLKRKYQANADLFGALRFILAANNENLLDEIDAGSKADFEAIAQRFLYVRVDGGADFLAKVPRETLEQWATRGIAEHALWLAQNHEVKSPGKRFVVEGDIAEIHRLLLTGGHWTSLVCEWLIRYLINPAQIRGDIDYAGLVRIYEEQLLVNEQVIADKWAMYLPNTHQDPVIKKIGQALRAISLPERRQLRHATKQIRYRVIVTEHLIAWCDRYGVGDEQLIRDRLSGALPIDASVRSESIGYDEKEERFNY